MHLEREIRQQVQLDLLRKMVFIGGPRQVGKTTFALSLTSMHERNYLNWDIDEDRRAILKKELGITNLLILDEIHKFKKWRAYLKGLFDAIKSGSAPQRQILVTGSARLDYYRYGGDSLQGRYHYIRLLPLSFREIQGQNASDLDKLLRYGGFPEPFILQSETESRRWSREYRTRLVREDIRDLELIQDVGSFELLMNQLPHCTGSPLSINSLREDLQVAHKTVSKWVKILERMYYLFLLPPMSGPKIRAVKKEQKSYFYDWTLNLDEGAKFENLVALHLLKHVYFMEDSQGENMELRYFRDTDAREVDFVLLKNGLPLMFIECKLGDQMISPHLKYLCAKYPKVDAYQISLNGHKDYQTPDGIRVCPAHLLLKNLS